MLKNIIVRYRWNRKLWQFGVVEAALSAWRMRRVPVSFDRYSRGY